MIEEKSQSFKKNLPLLGIIALGVGVNIGSAIFIMPAEMVSITGSSLVIARLVSMLPVLLCIPGFLMLTSAYPTTGGNYRYNKLVSPAIAVGMIWVLIITNIFGLAFMSLGFGISIAQMTPNIPVEVYAFAVLTLFYVINLLKIKTVGWVQILMVGALLLGLILFIIFGIPHIKLENLALEFPSGFLGVITVAALTFQICAGGLLAIDTGGELKDGGRTFLKALPISLFVVIIISLLVEITAYGTIGTDALAASGNLAAVVQLIFPFAWMIFFFLVIGSLLATTSTVHSLFTFLSRNIFAVSYDKVLPSFLSNINKRFGSPHWSLTFIYVISSIILVVEPSIVFLSAMTNIGLTSFFMITLIATMIVPKKYPQIYENALYKPKHKTLLICGSLAIVLMSVFIVINLFQIKEASFFLIGVFLAGLIFGFIKNPEKFHEDDTHLDVQIEEKLDA